jgi:dTMP kinase
MAGKFITIEGIEGAGKSTAVKVIVEFLTARGHEVVVTREPGGTPLAEQMRKLLLDPDAQEAIDPKTELLLMFAGRAQHIAQVIHPALRAGNTVVCDRFVDASYAYQGAGRGLPAEWIAALDKMVVAALCPDATILLDVDPALGLQRSQQRGPQDRFEKEKVAFFEKVRHAYLERARQEPARFHVIDASQTLERVTTQLQHLLEKVG